jgi:glycosyltransferase involved in cell wall biosynthesis
MKNLAEPTEGVVQVLGNRSDVPELIEAADVICLTSSSEALPMVVIEAMALARPVVATNVGGTGDLVVRGETGDLVGRDDLAAYTRALTELAADRGRLERYGKAAQTRYAKLFTVDRMIDSYAELLEGYETNVARSRARNTRLATELDMK